MSLLFASMDFINSVRISNREMLASNLTSMDELTKDIIEGIDRIAGVVTLTSCNGDEKSAYPGTWSVALSATKTGMGRIIKLMDLVLDELPVTFKFVNAKESVSLILGTLYRPVGFELPEGCDTIPYHTLEISYDPEKRDELLLAIRRAVYSLH